MSSLQPSGKPSPAGPSQPLGLTFGLPSSQSSPPWTEIPGVRDVQRRAGKPSLSASTAVYSHCPATHAAATHPSGTTSGSGQSSGPAQPAIPSAPASSAESPESIAESAASGPAASAPSDASAPASRGASSSFERSLLEQPIHPTIQAAI